MVLFIKYSQIGGKIQVVDKSTNGGYMDTARFLLFSQGFKSVVKDIKRKESSYMKKYGLRSVHLSCLLLISLRGGGMTVTELAKESNTDKALISRIIRELLDDGFVLTEAHGEEKIYNKKYFLTHRSEEIVADVNTDIGEYMAEARSGISAEDMIKFYETLAALSYNISLIAGDEQ